ncbi:MAG: Csp1 family four helix bundle copper storage protein [Myxococcaceae bacterium]
MNRRDALKLTAAGVLAGTAALAADPKDAKAPAAPAAAPAVNTALLDAIAHCQKTGAACLELAIATLAKGDVSMAECANTTRAMLSLCESTGHLARMGNAHLKELAKVCAAVCRDCEKACKRHELHHTECKDCAQSCSACAAECDKV